MTTILNMENQEFNKKSETIGHVSLDYTHYAGRDLYCDGDVEDELLQIVKNHSAVEYPKEIAERAKWPILYHLSNLRENIVEWLPIQKSEKVLEVGSGCGAITGAFTAKAGEVVSVDLSRKRSLINAYRHEAADNLTIHVGNFRDVEPDLPQDFDWICLIGVFEYGQAYIGGEHPFEDFLTILKKHLKPGGHLVIAIENKLGLKYWAGCREDHLGTYFSGIEDYPDGGVVRTFTKRGLLEIAEKCGFASDDCHMYYPYPDYKFMHTLFSDRRLPKIGECKDNLRNFDRDRMLLFREKQAFDNLIREGEFPLFSNSYMLVLGSKPELVYARYSNDRSDRTKIRTALLQTMRGSVWEKKALTGEAAEHLTKMQKNYALLTKRYDAGSRLQICPCEVGTQPGTLCFPAAKGISLEEMLDECVRKQDLDRFHALLDEYMSRISYGEPSKISNLDLIFSNILVDGDHWTVIDYEWVLEEEKTSAEIAFRALYCYLLEDERRDLMHVEDFLTRIGITDEMAENFRHQEMLFQKEVTQKHLSMGEIRELIGNPVMKLDEISGGCVGGYTGGQIGAVQVYHDNGNGFSEEQSYFPKMQEGGYNLKVPADVKLIRVDPAMCACMVNLDQVLWNGENLLEKGLKMHVNGRKMADGLYLFQTMDPGFTLALDHLEKQGENLLQIKLTVLPIPEQMANKLAENKLTQGIRKVMWDRK